jgi:hypothetical protein
MKILPVSLLCCAVLCQAASLTAAVEPPPGLACPEQVAAEQKPVSPPAGWTAGLSAEPHRLEQVDFFDGPPEERASLIYDDIKKAGKQQVAVWSFAANPRGFWISCAYSGTAVILSRRLPATVKSCRVTYEKTALTPGGLPVIQKIDCR